MPAGVVDTWIGDSLPLPVVDLQMQFQNSSYGPLRQLSCRAEQGCVVLRGTVPSYYLKQVAQTLALKTVSPDRLCSNIEVRPE